MSFKTVIIITGPTAVGKTVLSIQLAQLFNTSIISADSRQCFKELNIGVAKPNVEELATVPHYFINSHSIHDKVDAVLFEAYAFQAVNEIFQTHDVAVMVGGTGMYIKAFCEGLDAIPEVDEAIQKEVREQYQLKGLEWLQTAVAAEDPEYYNTGETQNPQRMMRALEVKRSSGKSIRSFQNKTVAQRDFNIIKIGLELPRNELTKRIDHRVDIMMQHGLLDEVKSLQPYQHLNALQTVGYKELFEYISGNISLDKAVEQIKINTRQYAKRQMTWFKKDAEIKWFNAFEEKKIIEYLLTTLSF